MTISNQQLQRVEEIQLAVCEYYNLTLLELISKARPNCIAHPRMISMFLCRRETRLSLVEIGQRHGGRDHGTVIHACKRVSEMTKDNPETNDEINSILTGERSEQLKTNLMKNENEIIQWADGHGIFQKATPASQFEKMLEEIGELSFALYDQDLNSDPEKNDELRKEVLLELGDVLTTGVILAHMLQSSTDEVMSLVWDKIKDRTGSMKDGQFVKDTK